MGLCKCPKKKFTNQFCFEHRVNVCEYCMLDKHPKCIVQSYVVWLKDSDYKSICEICQKSLNVGECIRLYCYDLFHWSCFNEFQKKIPSSKLPSAYVCPKCKLSVFPPEKTISPVADVVRKKLETVNWARNVFNLGLVVETDENQLMLNETSDNYVNSYPSSSESVINVDDTYGLIQKKYIKPQSQSQSNYYPVGVTSKDNDDKYHKKFPLRNTILLNIFRNAINSVKQLHRSRKFILIVAIFLLLLLSIFYFQTEDENDVNFNLGEINFEIYK